MLVDVADTKANRKMFGCTGTASQETLGGVARYALDPGDAQRLWILSEKLVNSKTLA